MSTNSGSTFVTTGTPTISASSILFPITSGNLNITNGTNSTISLFVYLKSSGLTDNQILEFNIPSSAHGFTADATGSTFSASFAGATTSNQVVISVIATKLRFVQQPTNTGTNLTMTPAVTIESTDDNNNRDLDKTGTVGLASSGTMAGPVTASITNGFGTFGNIIHTATGSGLNLTATLSGLSDAGSNNFEIVLLPSVGQIIINQFSPDYNGASDEYIEILNKTDQSFDLSFLKIEYQSSSGGTGSAGGNLTFTLGPYEYWLLSPNATITVGLTSALSRDGAITVGFAAASGQFALRLKNSPNTIIDGLAYGTVSPNNLGEGSTMSSPPTDGGLIRTPDGFDADENSTDFTTVANANIYLRNHNSINVSGNYTLPNTTYSADVWISNSADVIMSGNTTIAGKLTILSGTLNIASDQDLTVSGTLTNSAGTSGLIIKSDATGTGSFINSTADVDARVERYLTDYKWHFIGMPVESGKAGVFHLPSGHSDIWLRTHIESTNSWSGDIVPIDYDLIQGRGYECWVGDPDPGGFHQPETVVFPGKLNAGNYTTGTGGFYALEYTSGHGLNLICNPYPSALQANIHTWTKTNIANSVWTWNPTAGNYVYWNGIDGTGGGSGVGTLTGGVIPSMQAFFVLATGASPSLTIPQSDRLHSSQAYYKDSGLPFNTLRLDVTGNGYNDAMFVSFNEQSTEDYDVNYDVEKIAGLNEAPQLFAEIAGKQLSINALPNIGENRIVNIGFECSVFTSFTIDASGMDGFNLDVDIYLEDLKTAIVQNLKENPVYAFTGEAGDLPSRFLLHFNNNMAVPENPAGSSGINAYVYHKDIYITSESGVKGTAVIYDLLGKEIVRENLNGESVRKISLNDFSGFAVVTVISDKGNLNEKVYIQ
ncbi:MAG: lamin tail domain-containing protein [Bacteroidetes bacterium]|nr:lamin tail domain-containing protein [Bacteroidota bacterium]